MQKDKDKEGSLLTNDDDDEDVLMAPSRGAARPCKRFNQTMIVWLPRQVFRSSRYVVCTRLLPPTS